MANQAVEVVISSLSGGEAPGERRAVALIDSFKRFALGHSSGMPEGLAGAFDLGGSPAVSQVSRSVPSGSEEPRVSGSGPATSIRAVIGARMREEIAVQKVVAPDPVPARGGVPAEEGPRGSPWEFLTIGGAPAEAEPSVACPEPSSGAFGNGAPLEELRGQFAASQVEPRSYGDAALPLSPPLPISTGIAAAFYAFGSNLEQTIQAMHQRAFIDGLKQGYVGGQRT